MTPSRIHRLDPHALPQLSRGEPCRRAATSWCWWGRTAPARPIAWRRSRFCRRDAACAARRWRMSPTTRATAPGRCRPRSRARSGLPRSAPASMRPQRRPPSTSRRCRIDREPVSSATAFGDHLRMVWLTPAMDGLFLGAASERRRFFDRLVLAIDSEHSSRVSALERSLRSRNRLLEVRNYDDHWCDAIERETAELAVAVAATRGQTVTRLAAMLRERGASFRLSVGTDHARRLDGKRAGQRVRDLSGGPLPRDPARTAAPATPQRAARWTARTSPICRWSTRRKTCRRATPPPASRRRC